MRTDIRTEQTLGRGLRLPYGVRTGVEAVGTLTVIAHDRLLSRLVMVCILRAGSVTLNITRIP
jgi:hypothetical protein